MTIEKLSSFKTKKIKNVSSFAPPVDTDGGAVVIDSPNVQAGGNMAAGFFGTYLDVEGSSKTESDLIQRYREIAGYPECDMAIEDIVNEAISDLEDERLVTVNLSDARISESLKKKVQNEFEEVIKLLGFEKTGHNTFKRWYIDGRIYFHKIIDENNPSAGIKELRYLDPRKMKKVVTAIRSNNSRTGVEDYAKTDDFFIYTNNAVSRGNVQYQIQGATASRAIKIPTADVAYVTSGEVDQDRHLVLSFLHKAIKIVNQVRMMEDSLVIYRLSRAPERRIFYIDTGNMPKPQAEAHVKNLMTTYRNKTVYDSVTGAVKDDRKFAAITEDFWIPRQNGSNSTEIDTLPGGENLDSIADILYFQKNLYKAMNVPVSRLTPDSNVVSFGRQSEVSRDELKFSKFVQRLRRKFSELFMDLLKTQLILKNIFTMEDWESIVDDISFSYSQDSYYAEAKETEILRNRVEILTEISPYIGIFFDKKYVYEKILRMSEEEIQEREKGILEDQQQGFFGVTAAQQQQQQMIEQGQQQEAQPQSQGSNIQQVQAPEVANQP